MSGIPAIMGFVAFLTLTSWMILHLWREWNG
jgi:hypothetical protein